jgi:hypothetical protein
MFWACSSTRIFYSAAAAVFVCIVVQGKVLLGQEQYLSYCYPCTFSGRYRFVAPRCLPASRRNLCTVRCLQQLQQQAALDGGAMCLADATYRCLACAPAD